MIDFTSFFSELRKTAVFNWADVLEQITCQKLEDLNHGDFVHWKNVLESLPSKKPSTVQLSQPSIQVGSLNDLVPGEVEVLKSNLKKLHPWRKGPFELFGVSIDAEWRSNLKWDRVLRTIQPLTGRTVLDLGCGNGYYLWRMLGAGASFAMGVDSSLLCAMQFQSFQKYIQNFRCSVLPIGVEDLPKTRTAFDTVFSMGILYHRRDPIEHLRQIFLWMRDEGEVVLETLVVNGPSGEFLKPGERYAKMRNVWSIPTCGTAELWLKQAGFKNIRCADVSRTITSEQRKTEWMQYESLEDFLNPQNPSQTIEGYPSPERALFTASK